MKGGRTAPRNRAVLGGNGMCMSSFNEGGADCPPKPRTLRLALCRRTRFNEGGADCPPKPAKAEAKSGISDELQ